MESFWVLRKHGYHGTFHEISHKHLDRYSKEFVCRLAIRELETVEQMELLSAGMVWKRLTNEKVIEPNGRESGSRPFERGKIAD